MKVENDQWLLAVKNLKIVSFLDMIKLADFKIPCSFEKRKPFLLDGFLFIPGFYEAVGKHGPKLDLEAIFGNKNAVQLEYCSGNGSWIADKAQKNQNLNWIAVEKDFDRARKIWLKAKRQNLKNLFLIFGEAFVFTWFYLPENSIQNVFINFPDPWPKRRHHKKRLVKTEFLLEIKKKLLPDGKITLVTDHEDLAFFMIKEAFQSGLRTVFEEPYFKKSFAGYGSSFFEELFRAKGKKIHYMQFQI